MTVTYAKGVQLDEPAWWPELSNRLTRGPRRMSLDLTNFSWSDVPVSEELVTRTHSPLHGTVLSYFSSGTGGAPKRIDYTQEDWTRSVEHRAELLHECGVRAGDLVVVLVPFGPWFSGDNIVDAALLLKAKAVPAGTYAPHLPAVKRLLAGADMPWLVSTASVASAVAQHPAPQCRSILIGEHVPRQLRARLQGMFGARPKSLYGASEALIGVEHETLADTYYWDPRRLHLEVQREDGSLASRGFGSLVVTKRHGDATPVVRHLLGDTVDLGRGDHGRATVTFHGRSGGAFTTSTAVKVDRADLDDWLNSLPSVVTEAKFTIRHNLNGTDSVNVELRSQDPGSLTDLRERFRGQFWEIADAEDRGFITINLQASEGTTRGKRRVTIEERPWTL